MPVASELVLPIVDSYDPLLRGPRYHQLLGDVRAQSWLASSALGFIALDHESGEFFLRDKRLTFPGMFAAAMFGVTEGPLHEQVARNILNVNGDDHRRLRALVNPALSPRAADRVRPAMRGFLGELIAPFSATRRTEAVADICKPYPSLTIDRDGRPAQRRATIAQLVEPDPAPVLARPGGAPRRGRAGLRGVLRLLQRLAGSAPR